MWMINHLCGIYKVNVKTKDPNRRAVFDRFAFYTEMVFKCGCLLYFLSMLSYLVYPFYMYLFEREIVTMLPIYLPGIDEATVTGFAATTCYHLTIMILACIAASAVDFLVTMLVINIPIMAMLIEMEVEKLNGAVTCGKELLVKSKMRNILLMHREMTE